VGTFMSFFVALGLLFAPIKRLTKVNEPLQKGLAAAESVFSLIDEKPEKEYVKKPKAPLNPEKEATRTREKKSAPASIHGNIQFKEISFQYLETDKPAVEQFNLMVNTHQTVALVGASGSGKSTVAQLLPRLYDWDQGEILLDGKNLRDFSLTELRQQMALVSQDVVLFNRSIAENIAYGTTVDTIDQARIQAVAEAANVTAFVQQLSDGFDTLIGDNGVRLSGGQRQRLAIARALYKDAPILILDEATSALDNESERLVQEAIDHLRKNRTTLVIAHRLSTIEKADHIVVMEQGKIVEQGDHQRLLAQKGYYARLYQHQFTA
ncbi:MAG TPA: ATP-binding cassette domain-containing protein, partial [Thiothrix sp.]|nr:ATP-binding cassette domain-containing protein [Thiothrix sp.]